MATAYGEFKKLNIDSSCLGLSRGESESRYFCTPKGAKVIGWAGTDGIHFCFARGCGETVFAVSPMNAPDNFVHPVARDFADFLRLLLTCGDAAALEQACMWNQEQFDAFLQDNPLIAAQRTVLSFLEERLKLTPLAQPFAYIKELQAEFDYSRITYAEEQAPAELEAAEWKVYFDGSFWGHHGRDRAGRELSLYRQFVWEDAVHHIPAIYLCGKGLVMDFCVQIPAERIRSFIDQWHLSAEHHGTDLTDEQQMRLDAENPLSIRMSLKATVNGTALSSYRSCGVTWNPCFPEGGSPEAGSAVRHYGLDPDSGWAIKRVAFPWTTKRRPRITALSVTVAGEPVAVPGPHFRVSAPGEQFEFIHPATGGRHTLTVREYERREMSREHFDDHFQEFPTHYTVMTYTLSPGLPDGALTVADCVRSDSPRYERSHPAGSQASAVSVGVIGGADGPTAIFVGGPSQGRLHAACSALRFEPARDVEWRMVFFEKRRGEVTVELI